MRFLQVKNSGQIPSGSELEDSLPLQIPGPSQERNKVRKNKVVSLYGPWQAALTNAEP